MQILPIVLLMLVSAVAGAEQPLGGGPVPVRAVIDGDTIDVGGVGRVRLLGIDAPEIGRGFDTSAPFAVEARERLSSLILHRWVRLLEDGEHVDAYNRHLAYVVREDGVFVNAELVRAGLARVMARLPLGRLAELNRAQAEAQQARRGMWGALPGIPSAGYTRRSASPADSSRAQRRRRTSARAGRRSRSKPKSKT